MRRTVVLPQPDGPRRVRNSPALMERLMSWVATNPPKRFVTFLSSTIWSMWLGEATEPIQPLGNKVDVDLLGFQVGIEAEGAEFASDPALLVAAPWGLVERGVVGVQPGDAGPEAFKHAQALALIAREDTSREPVDRVVGQAQGFLLGVEELHDL